MVFVCSYRASGQIDNENALTAGNSLFGMHAIELRGQLYNMGALAYLVEYKYRRFNFISMDVYLRSFVHAPFEVGGGVTLRLPVVQVFYAQATVGRPFNDAHPSDEELPTGIAFPFSPDYSYSFRGGMLLPLGEPVRSHFYLTLSAGKSWYVDTNNRYIQWMSETPPPVDDEYEYEIRTQRKKRGYGSFEIGLGVHF